MKPPPDLIEEEEEWEIERILEYNRPRNKRRYFVKWKGFSDHDNTWEPKKNLKHTQILLKDYKRRKQIN